MRRRWLHAVLALLMLSVFAWTFSGSLLAAEPRSAFDDGPGAALVEAALARGNTVDRLVAGARTLASTAGLVLENVTVLVLAPQSVYQDEDVRGLQDVMHHGGTVLVVDDFGQANSVTSGFGVTFERVRLIESSVDYEHEFRLPGKRVVQVLDQPTAIQISDEIPHQVLASSSAESYLDRDGSGVIDEGDPPGPFTVAAVADVGAKGGRLVVVGDTAPFLGRPEHHALDAEFLDGLLEAYLGKGATLIIDESHLPKEDPLLATLAASRSALATSPWRAVVPAFVLALAGLAAIAGLVHEWRRHRFEPSRYVLRSELGATDAGSSEGGPRDTTPEGAQWTVRGKVSLASGLSLLVLGVLIGNSQASVAGAILLIACTLALWTRRPAIIAERSTNPVQVLEEGSVQVGLRLESTKRRAISVEVRDGLPAEFELVEGESWFLTSIRRDRPLNSEFTVRPAVRGLYQIGPLLARTYDPFRLRADHATILPTVDIMVHPRHEPLSRIPFKSKISALTLGPHLVNRAGDGAEFHALRDYQTGDSIRAVNWKASARSPGLIVNQRVHESMATLTILIDARTISGAGIVRTSPINEACRAALSIATGAVRARDKIRVLAYGDGIQDMAPGKGADQIGKLTDALAALPAQGETTFEEALRDVAPSIKSGSPFIVITGLEGDDSFPAGLRLLRQKGILPTVLLVPITTRSAPDEEQIKEPMARVIESRHAAAVEAIRGFGIPIVPVKPGMPLAYSLRLGLA